MPEQNDRETITIVPETVDPVDLVNYFLGGPLPPDCQIVDLEEFMARGRPPDCDCGLIICVCERARAHQRGCPFRKALTCSVSIPCEHGSDLCLECDACTCECSGRDSNSHATVDTGV